MSMLPHIKEAYESYELLKKSTDRLLGAIEEYFGEEKCEHCDGTGEDPHPQYAFGDIWYIACEECNGHGYFNEEDTRARTLI